MPGWPGTGCEYSRGRAKRLAASACGGTQARVRDRSRAVGKRLRAIGRTLKRRSGEAKSELLAHDRADGQAACQLGARGATPGRRGAQARRGRLQRSRKAKTRKKAARILGSVERLEMLAERSEKMVEQIRKRLAGEPITDRLVSLFDPDARPIRKGKLGKPTEFGYVAQLAEVTPNTKPGNTWLPDPDRERARQPGRERAVAADRHRALSGLGRRRGRSPSTEASRRRRARKRSPRSRPSAPSSPGAPQPDSKRTQRRLARYRVGVEGRISHLKRRHGLPTQPPQRRRRRAAPGPAGRCSPTTSRPTHATPDPDTMNRSPTRQKAKAEPTSSYFPRRTSSDLPRAFIRGK